MWPLKRLMRLTVVDLYGFDSVASLYFQENRERSPLSPRVVLYVLVEPTRSTTKTKQEAKRILGKVKHGLAGHVAQ